MFPTDDSNWITCRYYDSVYSSYNIVIKIGWRFKRHVGFLLGWTH